MAWRLYYWRDYAKDTADGPIYKLNQNSPNMVGLAPGDIVWAIASIEPGRYVLAAEFKVEHAGKNPTTDPDRERYGTYFFVAAPSSSRYFNADRQPSVQAIIRNLSIKVDADSLGMSFQGSNGVRILSYRDSLAFSEHAAGLALDRRLNGEYLPNQPVELASNDLEQGNAADDTDLAEKQERLVEIYCRDQTLANQLKRIYEGKCQICGSVPYNGEYGNITEAHHIKWLCRGGSDTLDNLVLLCPNHHAAMHSADPQFDSAKNEFQLGAKKIPIRLNRHLPPCDSAGVS